MTSWPAFTQTPPIAPPTLPEPTMPIFIFLGGEVGERQGTEARAAGRHGHGRKAARVVTSMLGS